MRKFKIKRAWGMPSTRYSLGGYYDSLQDYAVFFNVEKCLPMSSGKVIQPLVMLWDLISSLIVHSGVLEPDKFNQSLIGVALALERSGYKGFIHTHNVSLSVRIRQIVLANPDRDWCSADFEECLHMSGATLRRRLAEENTSLRVLLRRVRLHYALTLLQTTHKPIKIVAQECGYNSQSCFTRNFISHFGIEPSSFLKKCNK